MVDLMTTYNHSRQKLRHNGQNDEVMFPFVRSSVRPSAHSIIEPRMLMCVRNKTIHEKLSTVKDTTLIQRECVGEYIWMDVLS